MPKHIKVNREKFVKNYRKIRNKKGLSTMTVAHKAHMNPSYAYHLTSFKGRPVTASAVIRIGKGLGMNSNEASNWLNGISSNNQESTNSTKPNNLEQTLSIAMKDNKLSPKGLAKSSGLKPSYVNKLLNAKKLVKLSKMDMARLANSLKLNVSTLEKAKENSIKRVKKDKSKDDEAAKHREAGLLKYLTDQDKKDRKRRAKNTGRVTQHIHSGDVKIGNSKNPFSTNQNQNNQSNKSDQKNPFSKDRLNVKALTYTAEQLSDMDISILNMVAQRLVQAEIKNNHLE